MRPRCSGLDHVCEWQRYRSALRFCHASSAARRPSVAVLGTADMSAFELGVACEVFGTDRSDRGIPLWDFALCLDAPGPLRCRSGFTLDSPYGLDRLAAADLVIVPSWPHLDEPPPEP